MPSFGNGCTDWNLFMELQGIHRRLECVVTDAVRARMRRYTSEQADENERKTWAHV